MPTFTSQETVLAVEETCALNSRVADIDREKPQDALSTRRELVTITVSRDDCAKLKSAGGPHPTHIDGALRHYLNVMKETPQPRRFHRLGWRRGPVVRFLCAIPKHLSDGIRSLSGRFDSHTIQAFRIFFL